MVGIAPPSLLVPTGALLHPMVAFAPRIDVWKPIAPTKRELEPDNESWDHGLLVRLRPGENPERGRQQLQAILNAYYRALVPEMRTELLTQLVPIREIYAGKVRLRLLLILGGLRAAAFDGVHEHRESVPGKSGEPRQRVRHAHRAWGGTSADPEPDAHGDHLARDSWRSSRRCDRPYGAGLLAAYGPDDVRLLADTRFEPAGVSVRNRRRVW